MLLAKAFSPRLLWLAWRQADLSAAADTMGALTENLSKPVPGWAVSATEQFDGLVSPCGVNGR
ncbi:hypothetical protein AB8A21_24155 [Streptomyces sp. BF23-18]|uniref:hypothetical protein n=1 Tax=Streptomyces sp. BF23-18 TaxID=3240282 RepID=UPI0034E48E68